MFEPWQPPVEKGSDERVPSALPFSDGSEVARGPTVIGSNAGQPRQSIVSQSNSSFGAVSEAELFSDRTEVLSDALPDPVLVGQQYAGGSSSGRPPRRGAGLPETPAGRLLSEVFEGKLRTLAELEPSNPILTRWEAPNYRPTQRDINKVDLEIAMARQRVPGAVDSQASGIGVGPFARESIPARSGRRDWTEEERAEINRIGERHGCHTCGTRNSGIASGNFFGDHQSPTRLNPSGQNQIVLPQCMSCSVRQGGLVSSTARREKP